MLSGAHPDAKFALEQKHSANIWNGVMKWTFMFLRYSFVPQNLPLYVFFPNYPFSANFITCILVPREDSRNVRVVLLQLTSPRNIYINFHNSTNIFKLKQDHSARIFSKFSCTASWNWRANEGFSVEFIVSWNIIMNAVHFMKRNYNSKIENYLQKNSITDPQNVPERITNTVNRMTGNANIKSICLGVFVCSYACLCVCECNVECAIG